MNWFVNKNKNLLDIINSLNANTLDSNGAANQNNVQSVNTNTNNTNPNIASNGYSLTHKRSDICVEWTDSVNKISLKFFLQFLTLIIFILNCNRWMTFHWLDAFSMTCNRRKKLLKTEICLKYLMKTPEMHYFLM